MSGVLAMTAFVATVLLALGLFAVGMLFITDQNRGFLMTGHERASLPAVMGGRYLGLGMMISGLLAMGEYRALGFAFAIGAGLGFFDAVVTSRVGGSARGHFVVGLIAAVLSLYYFANSAPGV